MNPTLGQIHVVKLTAEEAEMLLRARPLHRPVHPQGERQQVVACAMVERGLLSLRDGRVVTTLAGFFALCANRGAKTGEATE